MDIDEERPRIALHFARSDRGERARRRPGTGDARRLAHQVATARVFGIDLHVADATGTAQSRQCVAAARRGAGKPRSRGQGEAQNPAMTLSGNAQLVADVFAELAKGNGAAFWDACHDDVVWRTIGTGSWSGEFAGKQTIIDEIFRPLGRALAERATIPTRLIDGGDVVVLQARGRNLTRDGRRYDNDYAFVITFRDGKIARYEEYCDTELIARVLPDRIAAKSMPKSG